MSNKFSKPHFSASNGPHRRFRVRTYPYMLERATTSPINMECEACKRNAYWRIVYEIDSTAPDASVIFLCTEHEKLTRYGKWDQVFSCIDRKIEAQNGL